VISYTECDTTKIYGGVIVGSVRGV